MYENFDKTDLGAPFNASREFKRHGQRNLPLKAHCTTMFTKTFHS